MKLGAVILAGGSSRRMGVRGKKEFLNYKNKPLLYWTISPFMESGLFDTLCLVGRKEDFPLLETISKSFPQREILICEGGAQRHDSVRSGLELLDRTGGADAVYIHDGARPFVSADLLLRLKAAISAHPAVIPVEPSVSAMKIIDEEGYIQKHLDRPSTVGAQTPQVFVFTRILQAHRRAEHLGQLFLDDAELWSEFQPEPVLTIKGDPENKKITYPRDLESSS